MVEGLSLDRLWVLDLMGRGETMPEGSRDMAGSADELAMLDYV